MNCISHIQLRKSVCRVLVAKGLPEEQAETVADCFVTADLYGVSTHGVAILHSHLERITRGGYNLSPIFKEVRSGGAFTVVDADNAMGPVSAVYCMKLAMDRCLQAGIYTVLCRNANTYGPAFYYPFQVAQQGFIGITFSNSPAAMPPAGGREALLGTNPFAIVVPCEKESPVVLDMATSIVAKSKINELRKQGETIPAGWALDAQGNPTTDPVEAIKGLVLPMAGFKGYGIAMMLDVLSGVLAGATYLNEVGRFYNIENHCMNVGQTFIVLDPKQIFGDGFYAEMDVYVKKIRDSKPMTEGGRVLLPGDDRMKVLAKRMIDGIELDDALIRLLEQ